MEPGSLDLAHAIELAKGLEAAERGAAELRKLSRLTSEPSVQQLTITTTAAGTSNRRARRPPGEMPSSASQKQCFRCGSSKNKADTCKFAETECHNCGKKGHLA